VNKAMADEMQRLYGRRPKVGDSHLEPFADHPADTSRMGGLWDRALSGESFVALERLGHDSDARWYEIKFDVLKDESGTRLAAFQFGYDVTERILREEQLAETQEALRQSQKMEAVGQLTGGIAHDFNNLLTGIIGAMDILKRRIRSGQYDDTVRFMDAAIASANRAAALTHRLLAFARRQPLAPRTVDVNRLVRGTEELLNRTLGERIVFSTDLAEDLWPVLSDPNQLESALLNLAINARDAMPDGGRLTITTRAARLTSPLMRGGEEIGPGDYAVISVHDTGSGMAPDVLAKVFEPFFTTKPIGQGTGLGLSMIYGFAKQSRGHVQIESSPGNGTVVRLFLPRFTGEADADPRPSALATPWGAGRRCC
jgi:signal transduction histidine kinase